MANVNTTILSLPPTVGALAGNEVVALVQNGTTRRATVASIAGATIVGTFANNAAALAGGLVAGNIYQTVTGEVRVVV